MGGTLPWYASKGDRCKSVSTSHSGPLVRHVSYLPSHKFLNEVIHSDLMFLTKLFKIIRQILKNVTPREFLPEFVELICVHSGSYQTGQTYYSHITLGVSTPVILRDIKKDPLRSHKITNDLDTTGSRHMHLPSRPLECLESSPNRFGEDRSLQGLLVLE